MFVCLLFYMNSDEAWWVYDAAQTILMLPFFCLEPQEHWFFINIISSSSINIIDTILQSRAQKII